MSIDDRDLVYGRFLHDLYRRWWLAVLVGGGFNYITMKNFKGRTVEYFAAKIK